MSIWYRLFLVVYVIVMGLAVWWYFTTESQSAILALFGIGLGGAVLGFMHRKALRAGG